MLIFGKVSQAVAEARLVREDPTHPPFESLGAEQVRERGTVAVQLAPYRRLVAQVRGANDRLTGARRGRRKDGRLVSRPATAATAHLTCYVACRGGPACSRPNGQEGENADANTACKEQIRSGTNVPRRGR